MKKSFLLLLSCATLIIGTTVLTRPHKDQIQGRFTRPNTTKPHMRAPDMVKSDSKIIVFDLHDVLVERKFAQFMLDIRPAGIGGFFDICKMTIRYCIGRLSKAEFHKAYEYYLLKSDGSISQETLKAVNCHVPKVGAVELLQALKKKGYHLFICTNAGEKSYKILADKYPELFNLIDGYWVTSAKNKFVTKHSPRAFEECAQIIQQSLESRGISFSEQKNPVTLLLIDDSPKKIKVAESVRFDDTFCIGGVRCDGFKGIHFQGDFNALGKQLLV